MSRQTMLAVLACAALAAPAAQAQSHSVTNEANPPQSSSDSKAATEATPGLSATAEDHDLYHRGKSARNARANKARPPSMPPRLRADPDISKAQAGNVTKEMMQRDPSKTQVGDMERHAFDAVSARP
jgi:hypothetical protein